MKGLEKERKKAIAPYLLYSLGIFIVSVLLLVLAFKYGYQTQQEFRIELEKENIILEKREYLKLKKFSEAYPKEYEKFKKWMVEQIEKQDSNYN